MQLSPLCLNSGPPPPDRIRLNGLPTTLALHPPRCGPVPPPEPSRGTSTSTKMRISLGWLADRGCGIGGGPARPRGLAPGESGDLPGKAWRERGNAVHGRDGGWRTLTAGACDAVIMMAMLY